MTNISGHPPGACGGTYAHTGCKCRVANGTAHESEVQLVGDAPAVRTMDDWTEAALESLTVEDKDRIIRFVVAAMVPLAGKQEWDLDDNFAVTEGLLEELHRSSAELPPEGEECYECGMHVPDDFDDCPNTAEHEDD